MITFESYPMSLFLAWLTAWAALGLHCMAQLEAGKFEEYPLNAPERSDRD
jgi:hypothetical protein